jgi:hypothetical protein
MIKSSSQQEIRKEISLTPEEMFDIISGSHKGGIIEYEVPKQYFDYKRAIWEKKREKILKSFKGHWPPLDWKEDKETGKKKPPIRKNFIDESIKLANSFYDKKKAEEIKNELESKNKIIKDIEYKSDFDKKKNTRDLRKIFKERENEKKKIKEQINLIPEYKKNIIEEVKEKFRIIEEEREKNKNKKGKANFSKCDRITIVAEAEFIGEQIPFYNTVKNKNGEIDKKKLFYPNKLYKKNPSWSFGKKNKLDKNEENQYIKTRNEKLEEKIKNIINKQKGDNKYLFCDVSNSYNLVNNRGKLPIIFRKKFKYEETEQYKASRDKYNYDTPAPNSYWDDGKSIVKLRKNIDEQQAKKYIMNRDKTFKRLYVSKSVKSVF